jgi:flagellar basal-body rod protein FlgB
VKLFDPTLDVLQRALDVRLARHGLLAGNVANANTPGFVPRDLDFAAAMRERAQEPAELPVPRASMTLASAGHAAAGSAPTRVDAAPEIPLSSAQGAGLAPPAPLGPLASAPSAGLSGPGIDGNAVDVDRALAAVAENAIQYGAAARAAQKKLAILRYAASDGAAM